MRNYALLIWLLVIGVFPGNLVAQADVAGSWEAAAETYALVIGISEYPNLPEMGRVTYADKDAIAFADYLAHSGQVRSGADLVTLINEQATLEEVMTQLLLLRYKVASRSLKQQRVVLFFAGHSLIEGDNPDGGNVSLLLSDTPKDRYWNHALRLQDLQGIIAAIAMEYGVEVFLYLDAAHAPDPSIRARIGRQLHTQFAREVKFLSAFPGQLSLASPSLGGGQGLFAHFLTQGLRGAADRYRGDGDGRIEAGELEAYLLDNISWYSDERQQPLMVGNRLAFVASYAADPFAPEAADQSQPSYEPMETNAELGGLSADDPCGIADPGERRQAFYQTLFNGRWLAGGCDALSLFRYCPPGREKAEMRYRLANALNWQARQLLLEYREDELAGRPVAALDTLVGRLDLALDLLSPESVLYGTLRSRRAFFQAIADLKRDGARAEESMALLEEAIQLDPYSTPAYYALGVLLHQREEYESARKRLRQATVLSPDWEKPKSLLPSTEALAAIAPVAPASLRDTAASNSTVFALGAAAADARALSTPLPNVVTNYVYPQVARRNADAREYGFTWLGPQAAGYAVQLGVFRSYERALQALQRLKTVSHQPAFLHLMENREAPPVYRLLFGRFDAPLPAEGVEKYLKEQGFDTSIVDLERFSP